LGVLDKSAVGELEKGRLKMNRALLYREVTGFLAANIGPPE